MKHFSQVASLCAVAGLCAGAVLVCKPVYGQSVISAKSGLVHYTEGAVSVDGKPVSGKAGVFSQVSKDGTMTTTEGRAEVLMTPGVFLRVAEQSGIRMVSTSLSDTRVAVESGRVMLESDTPMKGNMVTLLYKNYAMMPTKPGLFEMTTNPPQFKVYSGEADVTVNGQTLIAREGKLINLSGVLAQERFPEKDGDDLYRWSQTRSGYISEANASSASTQSQLGYSGFNSLGGYGGNWFYNSAFGMYTYMPFAGTMYSPFGYGLWSPYSVNQAYPYGYGYGSSYYPTTGSTSSGKSSGSPAASLSHPVHLPTPPGRSSYMPTGGASNGSGRSYPSSVVSSSGLLPGASAGTGSASMGSGARGGGGASSGGRGH